MILTLALMSTVAAGPAMRLGPVTIDHGASVEILDNRGLIAARVQCPPNAWVNPRDSARALMGSPEVMAAVIATNGRLDRVEHLGPARYACVIRPA